MSRCTTAEKSTRPVTGPVTGRVANIRRQALARRYSSATFSPDGSDF